jgi:hypothetical protein
MSAILQIFLGLVAGLAGVFQIAGNPYVGCGAVLGGGVLVMEGINRLLSDTA